jgi:flagellar L-ring protein FlgH
MRQVVARAMMLLAVSLAMAGALGAATLWQAETLADGTLYSDQVARKKGDLITILVKETTSVTDRNQTETKRENTIDAAVNLVPGSSKGPATVGAGGSGTLPALSAAGTKDYKGLGNYVAAGEVKAVITGRVIDVLDNGNLVVEGRRSVKVNNDTKTILITGIIRTADIKADNTVMSEKLHNFQVSIEGEGPLSLSQQEGWLSRLLDIVWPF